MKLSSSNIAGIISNLVVLERKSNCPNTFVWLRLFNPLLIKKYSATVKGGIIKYNVYGKFTPSGGRFRKRTGRK